MNDWKSKIPDLKEVMSMGSQFGHDVASSVHRIVSDYKKRHFSPVDDETVSETTLKTTTVTKEKTETHHKASNKTDS